MEQVGWDDAQAFIKKLNARIPGFKARLPTEAEWEYAARAGTTEPRYGEIDAIGWHSGNSTYSENSTNGTHPVGLKQPNAWGLYDMLGNVLEWCSDYWIGSYDPEPVTDPSGPEAGDTRAVRGGAFLNGAKYCRAASRYGWPPDFRSYFVGLRLALDNDKP